MHRVAIIAVFAALCGFFALAAVLAAGGGAALAAPALSFAAGAAAVVLPQLLALWLLRRGALFSPFVYWMRKFLLTMTAFFVAAHVLREFALLSTAGLMLGVAAGLMFNFWLMARFSDVACAAANSGEKK